MSVLLGALVLPFAVGCTDVASPSLGAARAGEPDERAIARVRVVDGDTLDVDGVRHRLFGIDAPEAGRICDGAGGRFWRCGEAATGRLRELIGDAVPLCREVPGERDRFGRRISRCRVDQRDLGSALVAEGLAWAYLKYSNEQRSREARARRARLGIWQAPNRPAWQMRAGRRDVVAEALPPPDPGCRIKGNRSANGLIYHLPGSRDYDGTRIDPDRGERWFCSETEALAAGWRARRR